MLEEAAVTLAEQVQSAFSVAVVQQTVLGTLAVAQGQPPALAALARKRSTFGTAEMPETLVEHHLGEASVADIPQTVLRKHEMVAAEHVAVELHGCGLSAGGSHGAYSRCYTHAVGKCGIKQLHECLAYVAAHPLAEYSAEKIAPLSR